MATKKNRTTKQKDVPTRKLRVCLFCHVDHTRQGKYCSDACKQAAYRERKEAPKSVTEIVTNRHFEAEIVHEKTTSVEVQQFEMMIQAVRVVVREELSALQVTTVVGTQMSFAQQPVYQQPMRQLPSAPEPEIGITKASGGDVTANFLRSVSGVAGVNLTAPAAPQPERTIKLNGREVGIKRMDVPQFAPPVFEDED